MSPLLIWALLSGRLFDTDFGCGSDGLDRTDWRKIWAGVFAYIVALLIVLSLFLWPLTGTPLIWRATDSWKRDEVQAYEEGCREVGGSAPSCRSKARIWARMP